MALWRTHKKQQPNTPIQARTLRTMAETCDWVSRADAGAPVGMTSSAAGLFFYWMGMVFSVYVGKTNGTITARSGSTPGSGPVTRQTWNGAIIQPLAGVPDVTAYYLAGSPSTGIPSGKFCIILRIAGSYFIIWSECA